MTRKSKSQLEQTARYNLDRGIESARDLMWRIEVALDPKHPNRDEKEPDMSPEQDMAIIFAAWALSHFDINADMEKGLMDHLGVEWKRTPFGTKVLTAISGTSFKLARS